MPSERERAAQRPSLGRTNETRACYRVFNIPELLEKILIHLDMKTLLLAQRANKLLKDVIGSSAACQKALFFLADEVADENGEWRAANLNPLLMVKFAAILTRSTDINEQTLKDLCSSLKGRALRHKHASWRKMLVTQPPLIGVHAHL